MESIRIEKIPVEQMRVPDYYPRKSVTPGDAAYEQLKESMVQHGYVDPVVWNQQTGHIVSGYIRYQILMEEEPAEIVGSVVDLSLEQEKTLNVALNQHVGAWDEERLAELLGTFSEDMMALTAFEEKDVTRMIQDMAFAADVETPIESDGFNVTEALETVSEPTTKLGDVWLLGKHRLVCGDATKLDDIHLLMDGKKADLVITDPPYNVAVESESEALQSSGRGSILNDQMSDAAFQTFLEDVFRSYASLMAPNAGIYVFHPSRYQREFETAMNMYDIQVRAQCVWVKNFANFGWSQYRWQHEPVFYGHLKNQAPCWYADRKQSTVWRDSLLNDISDTSTVWEIKRDSNNDYLHPTQKPLDLIAIPMRNSSKKEDLIVDLFGGSGSTLMTSIQLDRICYTLELDPVFCDVIRKRFEEYTGIVPVLIRPAA